MPEPTEAQRLVAVLGHGVNATGLTPIPSIQPLCINQISQILLVIERLAEKGINLDQLSYTQLILRGGDDFRDILAIASESDPAVVGQLNILQAAQLAGIVWKVNKDFFDQNQIEILQAFGLEEKHLEDLKATFASIKSLLISAPAESPTSDVSSSPKSTPSVTPSAASNVPKSNASPLPSVSPSVAPKPPANSTNKTDRTPIQETATLAVVQLEALKQKGANIGAAVFRLSEAVSLAAEGKITRASDTAGTCIAEVDLLREQGFDTSAVLPHLNTLRQLIDPEGRSQITIGNTNQVTDMTMN